MGFSPRAVPALAVSPKTETVKGKPLCSMTIEDAQSFFEKNAYMTPNNARVEAMRGTQDPGYLRYQLGKLMILKLREDYKAKAGLAYTLQGFHDAFIKLGPLPMPLIRRAMLGEVGELF